MSFADFAAGGGAKGTMGMSGAMGQRGGTIVSMGGAGGGSAAGGLKPNKHVEAASLKLEQFQRQVVAIKRSANNDTNNTTMMRKGSASGLSIDDDLHDRIRFACLLQQEIAKVLTLIPQDATNSLIKRKLCKDFEAISTQLETSVVKISAREQAMQETLMEQQKAASHQGRIVAEHQGQVVEFEELENEIAHNEALIEEREKDIEKIHSSVAQVHEIFRDLATIVSEQQTAIDDIETHIHESLDQTQQGLAEVKKASEMQSTCVIQ